MYKIVYDGMKLYKQQDDNSVCLEMVVDFPKNCDLFFCFFAELGLKDLGVRASKSIM